MSGSNISVDFRSDRTATSDCKRSEAISGRGALDRDCFVARGGPRSDTAPIWSKSALTDWTQSELLYEARPYQRVPDPEDDEGLGARQPRRTAARPQARPGPGPRRRAGAGRPH